MARRGNVQVRIKSDFDPSGTRQAERSLDRLGGSTRKLGSGLGGLARNAGVAGAALGGGLVVGAKVAIDTASDVNESLTKNEQLFGRYAQRLDRFSKQSAESLGLSRKAALEATGTFGGLFEALDIADEPAAKMSKRLVTLAGDLASFNNASPEEALEALRAGLSGESEPMRRFNAFLSEGRVKTEAYSAGIAKSGEELTEQQKIQARYNLILKDTEKAHGDFERTSGGLANQQRILKAQFSDVAGSLGQSLLPAATRATKALTTVGGEISKLAERKDLDLGEKLSLSSASVRRHIIRPLEAEAQRAKLGERLADGVEKGLPKVLEAAGRGGTKAVAAFLRGWWQADGWGKLATVAFLTAKLGGFSAAGKWAAGRFAQRFGSQMPEAVRGQQGNLTRSGRTAGRFVSGAFAAVLLAEAPKIMAEFAEAVFGDNSFSEEARRRGWGDAFLPGIISPEDAGGPGDTRNKDTTLVWQPSSPGSKKGNWVRVPTDSVRARRDRAREGARRGTTPKLTDRPPSSNRSRTGPRAHGSSTSLSRGPTAHASAANSGIVALGKQLQSEGYTVGEHPAFGGVSGGHVPNSFHFRAMALDINGGPGGEPGSLDALHARLVGKPGVVELLWRVSGHYDHLHVAVSGSTNPLGGSSDSTPGERVSGRSSSSGPSRSEIRERAQRQNRRAARRAMAPTLRSLSAERSAANRTITRTTLREESLSSRIDLAERRNALDEEDLGTSAGRRERTGELQRVRALQARKAAELATRRNALARKIAAARNTIKALQSRLRRTRNRTQRRTISAQIRTQQRNIANWKAEARQLGFDFAASIVDIQETDAEIAEVAATADTPLEGGFLSNELEGSTPAEPDYAALPLPLQAGMALAGLTEDPSDDIARTREALAVLEPRLAQAQAVGNNEAIIALAPVIGSLREQVRSLEATIDERLREQNDLLKQQRDEALRNLNVSQAQYPALKRAVEDFFAGMIGGRVGLASASAGTAGMGARY